MIPWEVKFKLGTSFVSADFITFDQTKFLQPIFRIKTDKESDLGTYKITLYGG